MQSKNIVRLKAAGGGKTYTISQEANSEAALCSDNKKILLVTYTREGVDSIKQEIQKKNFGIIPKNIKIFTWFSFLLDEMIKPYQSYITDINSINGIYFYEKGINFKKSGTKERYITSNNDIRQSEVSNLVLLLNSRSDGKVIGRLELIYKHIFFDEIQDIAGSDLELLKLLFESNVNITCVGDNKQATFSTHRTTKNKNKTGTNIWKTFSEFEKQGLITQEFSLESKRCNESICNFANIVFHNENNIISVISEKTEHDGVYLIRKEDVSNYLDYFHPTLLRYDKRTSSIENIKVYNFGDSKGKTFERILIIPNKTFLDFLKGKSLTSPAKYYIAVTRAKYSIAIVINDFSKYPNFIMDNIELGEEKILVMKFQI